MGRLRIWHAKALAFGLFIMAELLVVVSFWGRDPLIFNLKNSCLPFLVALPFFEGLWQSRSLKKLATGVSEVDAKTIAYKQASFVIMVYVSINFILIILLGRN